MRHNDVITDSVKIIINVASLWLKLKLIVMWVSLVTCLDRAGAIAQVRESGGHAPDPPSVDVSVHLH